MASLEDLYEDDYKYDESDDDRDSNCTPMCQQMSLIEHPLSLSRSLSENNTHHNDNRLPSTKSECNR
jgi:hypothetical protein